ncbi:MAG: hypothetical protein J0M09_00080 [Xanthomonadales bacterium]|nr:hypothetical protein [Xanthomonadales bacterium]
MSAFRYGLIDEQVAWVEDVLSNDENSTDTELLTYFTSHGLSQEQASNVLRHREDYLLNIYLAGHGSLHDN